MSPPDNTIGSSDVSAEQRNLSESGAIVQDNALMAAALDLISDAVVSTNAHGYIQSLNPSAARFIGSPASEALGRPFDQVFQFVCPDTGALIPSSATILLQPASPSEPVRRLVHLRSTPRSGARTLIEKAQPVFDTNRRLIGVVTVLHEITNAQAASRLRNEELLNDFFENASIGMRWVGPDGTILRANDAELKLLGYRKDEYVGRHIAQFHVDPTVVGDLLRRLTAGECLEGFEARLRCKDGSIKHVLIASSVYREDGKFIHTRCFTRDITEKKLAELALHDEIATRQQAEAALRDADRRKDEFLAMLAHELRNPLAPIRQAARISKSATATEAQRRWSQEVIDRQVQHMSLLLNDLLDISRVTRGTLELRTEKTELAEIINAAIETARPLIDAKQHRLIRNLPPEPVRFTADPLRLSQVLGNLLTNAAKYTDSGGTITVAALLGRNELQIVVADTGIGISPEALPQIFVMFSQVPASKDRSEGGLGIGLTLAKALVQLHGGTIAATSDGLGKGSQFIIRLPLLVTHEDPQEATRVYPQTEAVPRRILIADDNRDAADSLALFFRLDGHDVTAVHDGKAALEAFTRLLPEVAIFDIGMPHFDGYEVARQVRQHSLGATVTLIAITGWGQEQDKARALAAGFNHHFVKPIDPDQLGRLLRQ